MGQSIWGALAAGAAALLICQTILQIVYAAGNAGWATDAHTKRVLQLFGLTKADGAKHVILVRRECGLQASCDMLQVSVLILYWCVSSHAVCWDQLTSNVTLLDQ